MLKICQQRWNLRMFAQFIEPYRLLLKKLDCLFKGFCALKLRRKLLDDASCFEPIVVQCQIRSAKTTLPDRSHDAVASPQQHCQFSTATETEFDIISVLRLLAVWIKTTGHTYAPGTCTLFSSIRCVLHYERRAINRGR